MARIKRPAPKRAIPASAKRVFKGVIYEVYQWEQELFDGSKATFEMLKRPDTVEILPVTTEGKILINYEEQPGSKPFVDVPAGRMDFGDDPELEARRELVEETGYEPEEMILWDTIQPSSKMDWLVFMFIAKGCRKVSEPKLESGEKIETKEVNFDEFMRLISDDKFRGDDLVLKVLRAKENNKLDEVKNLLFS